MNKTSDSTSQDIAKEPPAWQSATLPLLLLQEISKVESHGYALSKALESRGFARVVGAKLYPALLRLELDGYVNVRWQEGEKGPGRKIYSLTDLGQEYLAFLTASWADFTARVLDSDTGDNISVGSSSDTQTS